MEKGFISKSVYYFYLIDSECTESYVAG